MHEDIRYDVNIKSTQKCRRTVSAVTHGSISRDDDWRRRNAAYAMPVGLILIDDDLHIPL